MKPSKIIPFEKCFASSPKAIYWSDKNTLKITDVFISSRQEIWLKCPDCKHDFKTLPNNIKHNIKNNVNTHGCSYCANRILCDNNDCKTCFDKSFASQPKLIYWDNEKNKIKPRDIFKSAGKEQCWFNCEKCKHSFSTLLNSITNENTWCSYCGYKSLCDDENCKMCFDNSFASNKKSIFWSSNNILLPRQVSRASGKKYLFKCNKCNHEFINQLDSVAKGSWCSYCANKTLCDDDNCKMCFDNSFASCLLQKNWSPKNTLKPRQVLRCSKKTYIFLCECGHEFTATCDNAKKKKTCPYCVASSKIFCSDEKCQQCFNKSFASSKFINFWNYDKNVDNPRYLCNYNLKIYWFKCENQHDFELPLAKISSGRCCPICANTSEIKLYKSLIEFYPSLERQLRAKWCINIDTKRCLPFDFVIEEYKIIIELDGGQHFRQVRNWICPEDQQIRDKYKMSKANENGYSMIRILQEDVYNNKYNWINELKETIEKIKTENKIQNIFMCKKNEYNLYM